MRQSLVTLLLDKSKCLPEQLNFNGTVNCTESEEDIKCVLSCPQGFKFSYQPQSSYNCLYQIGIFEIDTIPYCYKENRDMTISDWKHLLDGNQITKLDISCSFAYY